MKTDCINDYIEKNISEKRKLHIYGVRDTAVKLAETYGVDCKKAEIAALFHDMFKNITQEEMNQYVQELNLPQKYWNNKNLAHGKVAAAIMAKDYGIKDFDMINAVSFHTTGRAKMSDLEKIIYIADAIEPNREYPGVEKIRKIAFSDLEEACILSLSRTMIYVASQGLSIDEDSIRAKEYLQELKI